MRESPTGCTSRRKHAASSSTLPPGTGTSWARCGSTSSGSCTSRGSLHRRDRGQISSKHGDHGVHDLHLPTWQLRLQLVNGRFEGPMVDLSISGGNLLLKVHGADKLWAFKSSLEIPLQHVAGIRADPSVAHGWWHGLRVPGTNIPGVITAGTFYQDGKRVFWDVHNPDNTVVIDLH